jgi:hypothetical protein
MANQTITQLPDAGPITGTELVPIVQNGGTYKTTASALAGSPVQTQTFLTLNQEPTLNNSRYLSANTGIGLTDGGAQSYYRISLNGVSGTLETMGNGFGVNINGTMTPRSITYSGSGITVANEDGQSGNPTISLTGQVLSLANASGAGFVALPNNGTVIPRVITGVADEIDITDGDGAAGNPTIKIADNPILPGSESVTLPIGNTASRPISPANGMFRYNSQTGTFEGYASGNWGSVVTGSGVTSVGLVMPSDFTVTNSPVTSSGDLTAAWASQTQNYFLAAPNGSSGTPSFRAMVAADVPTLNQNTTGQAGSVANAVTFNNGGAGSASGVTFDGSGARTISYNTIGAPKADGTGASGTWAIDISGNAATATSASSATTATTATNVAGGAANRVVFNTGSGATSFIAAPTISSTYLKWNGTGFEWSSVTSSGVTSVDVSGGTTGLSTSGGPVTSSGTITLAGTLITSNGGTGLTSYTAGDLLYYSSGTALSKLAISSSTYMLTSNGSVPQWSDPTGITVGAATSATNATNVETTATSTNANFYIPFVSASTTGNQALGVDAGITYNPSTNALTASINGGTF